MLPIRILLHVRRHNLNIVKKTVFPESIFSNLEKKDGLIAILFFICFFLLEFLLLYIIKSSPLFLLLDKKQDYFYIYHLLYVLIMDIPSVLIIFYILKYRKQHINTIGLRKRGLKSSLILGVILIVFYVAYKGVSVKLITGLIFYLFGVGFFEELIFRGFLWSRLVKGFGKLRGTFISGMFFGLAHAPIQIVFYNKPIIDVIVFGKMDVNILGGVVVAMVYIYIYSRNENILLPSFIHGVFDALTL